MDDSELRDAVVQTAHALLEENNGKFHRDTIIDRVSEKLEVSKEEATRQVRIHLSPDFNRTGWTYAKEYGIRASESEITSIQEQPGRKTDESFHDLTVLKDIAHPRVPGTSEYFEQELEDTDASDVEVLCRTLADGDFSPLLIGEAGTGKDTLVEYVCAMTNRPVIRVNFGSDVRYENLVGMHTLAEDQSMEWVDGALTHAVRYGWVFIADEINAAPPESTMPLHQVTEESDRAGLLLREESEVVQPHPQFRFVATMNPPRGGYGGAKQLNDAFKSRFYSIEVDYLNEAQEAELIDGKVTTDEVSQSEIESLCELASQLRDRYKQGDLTTPITTRELIKTCELAETMPIASAARLVLGGHAKENDKSVIRNVVDTHL